MDTQNCQISSKDFPDGKALEDHMRSHVVDSHALKSSSNQEQVHEACNASEQKQEQIHNSFSSSFSDDGEEQLQETLKQIGAVDSDSTAAGSTVLEDDKSTEEISKGDLFYHLFKRAKNSGTAQRKSSLTTVPNLSPEEKGAISLMMLSRDKWDRDESKGKEIKIPKTENQDSKVVKKSKAKEKYKCETCKMSFRSNQALGGHNAKHRRMEEAEAERGQGSAAAEKKFVCPHCKKVFPSGQALGGHKRSHYSYGVLKPVLKDGEKMETNKRNRQLSASHNQIIKSESSAAAASKEEI